MFEVPHTDPLYAELRDFFQEYARSFDAKAWLTFVSHYHEPALSVRGDGAHMLLPDRQCARDFFESVASAWRDEGYAHFTTRDLQVHRLGARCAMVTFVWEMRRQDGSEIRQWRQSYEVLRRGDRWQVIVSTFHAI
jgi:hypothetical protein